MNPFYVISDVNPNEVAGVRACLFAGQQKSPDCAGLWLTVTHARVHGLAPRATICENHLRQAVSDIDAFKTPNVVERKPKPKARRVEVPSL